MTQKERLVELILDAHPADLCLPHERSRLRSAANNLADYLLKNGVIVPPCKVGDILYLHCKKNIIRPVEVFGIEVKKDCTVIVNFVYLDGIRTSWFIRDDEFGKRIFLTREAAEQALKERNDEN